METIELNSFKEQVAAVIKNSQGYSEVNIDSLMEDWYNNKKKYIELFNNKVIHEVGHVAFDLDDKAKFEQVYAFEETVDTNYDNYELSKFIRDNITGFYDNKVIQAGYYTNKYGETHHITAGTKLLKAFKYFINSEECLKELQDKASMIIQNSKVEGTLCLSVHPLDFLSSSENTYNWRSCHALDGEYCAGNLSYMCDKSTVICYLRGADRAILPRFPKDLLWNSKKWRMLLYFSDKQELMFAGRQYPFFNRNILDNIKLEVEGLLEQNELRQSPNKWYHSTFRYAKWTNQRLCSWTDENTNTERPLNMTYCYINGLLFPTRKLIKDIQYKQTLHYNDLLQSTCYIPYYTYLDNNIIYHNYYDKDTVPAIEVGSKVKCCHCEEDYLITSDSMLCKKCNLEYSLKDSENIRYCDYCDTRSWLSDMHYVNDDVGLVCEDCYNQYVSRCDNCGENYLTSDLFYNEKTERHECQYCHRGLMPSLSSSFSLALEADDLPF